MIFRFADDQDLAAVAELRWRLKTDDVACEDRAAHDAFVEQFAAFETYERRFGEVFHWVADADCFLCGVMSVIIVRKVPAPGELDGRWGYLTNCYVLPEFRKAGIGSGLLTAITARGTAMGLELLVVWPSDQSYAFYERAGFLRPVVPLVLNLDDNAP